MLNTQKYLDAQIFKKISIIMLGFLYFCHIVSFDQIIIIFCKNGFLSRIKFDSNVTTILYIVFFCYLGPKEAFSFYLPPSVIKVDRCESQAAKEGMSKWGHKMYLTQESWSYFEHVTSLFFANRRKKEPMTKLLSSVEEVMASPGDPLGQPSSFTNLPGLGTNMTR